MKEERILMPGTGRFEMTAVIKTLTEALDWHARTSPEKVHIRILKENGQRGDWLVERGPSPATRLRSSTPGDIALIQYTSGSTGDPKGVVVTHRNIIANVRAIGRGLGVRPDDVMVCCLPLYRDMGLIGCWLCSLYFGLPVVCISPLAFVQRPERWLWSFHTHRGTVSPAPNFAYELCVRRVSESSIAGLELSSWRLALNGAETVRPATLDRFIRRYATYGFRPESMMPVYGLAESSVALAFAPLGRPPHIDVVQREAFQRRGLAQPAADSDAGALSFVSVGPPLPGHEVRIVDRKGRTVGERVEGHLQFRGPSSMQRYHRNPEATKAVQCDGWYRSGDLAYWANGEIFITGRAKDVIIQGGRNIHPQDVEALVAKVHGVRAGCVAAFGVANPETGTEVLVLVAETRETDPNRKQQIASEVKRRLAAVGISSKVVCLVAPYTIPKTPSGKVQRSLCCRLYLDRRLQTKPLPPLLQLGHVSSQAVWFKLGKVLHLKRNEGYDAA